MSKIPKKGNTLKKLKSFDPITLPPCLDSLTQKVCRVNYITHLKINSHLRVIPYWDPCLHGWTIDGDKLVPVWFVIPYWDPCLHGWTIDVDKLVPVWFVGNRVPD